MMFHTYNHVKERGFMSNRLSKIYTRSGDSGTTSLANGERVSKCSQRVEALGDVDELNCHIGLIVSSLAPDTNLHRNFTHLQHQLFDLGGELAVASIEYKVIDAKDSTWLEEQLDKMNQHLAPLKEFILPGGSNTTCYIHLARAVCRRAERRLINVQAIEPELVNSDALVFLNRLSDFLFVAARFYSHSLNEPEILWLAKHKRD